jgi:hypothetical protein
MGDMHVVLLEGEIANIDCCECERSFCQNVTCVWLPLQLYCGDDVHLSSFLQYVSIACSDRQQQQRYQCALWLRSPHEQHNR